MGQSILTWVQAPDGGPVHATGDRMVTLCGRRIYGMQTVRGGVRCWGCVRAAGAYGQGREVKTG